MIVYKAILTKIIDELAHSMRLKVLESRQDQVLIKEHRHVFEVVWMDNSNLKDGGLWKCDCAYEINTKLPCRHQLRAIFSTNQSILPYLPERWKLTVEASDEISKISRGR